MAAPMRRLALRELVFVMGEDQVETPTVYVEGLTEMRLAHCRALDVPAWTAASPRAVPSRLVGAGPLPTQMPGLRL